VKLPVASNVITHSRGIISGAYPVIEAREISGVVVVVFDYMAFPRDAPAKNLFGYSVTTGEQLWRTGGISTGATDAYTSVISEEPLVVGNFAGFDCQVDIITGNVVGKAFRK
jgi:hypothetical protein